MRICQEPRRLGGVLSHTVIRECSCRHISALVLMLVTLLYHFLRVERLPGGPAISASSHLICISSSRLRLNSTVNIGQSFVAYFHYTFEVCADRCENVTDYRKSTVVAQLSADAPPLVH